MAVTGLVWDGSVAQVVDDLELRSVGTDEVRVDVRYAGLCHSDVHRLTGHIASAPLPMVLGHEAVGTVVEAGPESGHRVGDNVVLTTVRACGICARCRAGSIEPCGNPPPLAAPPFVRGSTAFNAYQGLGAFATSTVISGHQAVTIPTDVPDTIAAVLGCAVVTGYGAVEYKAKILPGETVVVIGIGGIGSNVVQACRIAGAERIIAIDPNPRKRDYALQIGATDFIASGDISGSAAQIADLGVAAVDAVFDCVGIPETVEVFSTHLPYHGRIVMIGLVAEDAPHAHFSFRDMILDKAILGSRMGSVRPQIGVTRLIELYRDGSLRLDQLVSTTRPLREFQELTDSLLAGEINRGLLAIAPDAY